MNVSSAQMPQGIQAKIQTFIHVASSAGLQAMGINPNNTGQAPRGQTLGSPTNNNNTAGATTGGSPNGRPNTQNPLGLDTVQESSKGQGSNGSAQSSGQRATPADLAMAQGREATLQAIDSYGPPPVEERSDDGGDGGGQEGGAQDSGQGDDPQGGQRVNQGATQHPVAKAA